MGEALWGAMLVTFVVFTLTFIAYRIWRARDLRENHVIRRIPEARVVSAPELEEEEKKAEEEGFGEGRERRGTGRGTTRSIMMAQIVPMNAHRSRRGVDGRARDGRGDRGGGEGEGGEAEVVVEMHASMAVEEVVEEAVAVVAPTAFGTNVQVAVAEEQVFVEV